jgi:hypothetical protein
MVPVSYQPDTNPDLRNESAADSRHGSRLMRSRRFRPVEQANFRGACHRGMRTVLAVDFAETRNRQFAMPTRVVRTANSDKYIYVAAYLVRRNGTKLYESDILSLGPIHITEKHFSSGKECDIVSWIVVSALTVNSDSGFIRPTRRWIDRSADRCQTLTPVRWKHAWRKS